MITLNGPVRENPETWWPSYEARIGARASGDTRRLPDFLIVSPARTATTWLFDQLNKHPGVFMADEKEVRYFDVHWRTQSLDWYLDRFVKGGPSRCLGDATPSYAMLPDQAIAFIRKLMPKVKLVFCLREPVSRAWSQVKHNFDFHEANFANAPRKFEDVGHGPLLENMIDDYSLSAGDYEGQLRRWRKHFPREQFHVATMDDIRTPEKYLNSLFAFLAVDPVTDFSKYLLTTKSNETAASRFDPDVKRPIDDLYAPRLTSLATYAKAEFGLDLPWQGNAPADAEPLWVCDRADGNRVYSYRGKFWAIPVDQDDKGSALKSQGGKSHFPGAAFQADLDHVLAKRPDETAEDARLKRVLTDLARDHDRFQFRIPLKALYEYRGFVIVQWQGSYYGVRKEKAADFHRTILELGSADISRDIVRREEIQDVMDAVDLLAMMDRQDLGIRAFLEQVQAIVARMAQSGPQGQ